MGLSAASDDRCSKALERTPKAFNLSAPALVSFIPHGSSPEDFLKKLPSNDPQLVCYTGGNDTRDPLSHQWFIVVDKEIMVECESHLSCKALITLIAAHFAFNLKYNNFIQPCSSSFMNMCLVTFPEGSHMHLKGWKTLFLLSYM